MRFKRDKMHKVIVVVAIQAITAALHLVTGSHYDGPWPLFVNGYLIDILLPFSFYFLMTLRSIPFMRPWPVRAGAVLLAASAAEAAQRLDLPVLRRTFYPLDFAAYALGVGLTATVDGQFFCSSTIVLGNTASPPGGFVTPLSQFTSDATMVI